MVLNHLSSEHPYFREALGNPNAAHRGWFRWSTRKPDDRGPWGQEVWHPSPRGSEYYYGTFWRTMPDLDYGSPAVRDEAKRIATFWLTEMGADGFRLDAVPYLVEEGAAKIGTAGTHTFLREYAAHIRTVSPNAFTVGEVWDGIDRMVPYYPDQLESYFAFDLADTLVATIRAGSAAALMRRVLRFQREVPNQRWSTFVRNHDQTRTLTVLAAGAEDTAEGLTRAKMAATLLLTLPGLPFVYYGEEIGMIGDKPDELLRTPMPWDASPNAGFTRGTPWQPLEARWPTTNVAAQQDDSASLLSAYRRLIHLRAGTPALGGGDFVPFAAGHDAVAAYLRRNGESIVLVVANVGRRTRSGVTLTADDSVLTPGEYEGRSLLGGAPAASLTVATDGRVRGYMPLGAILPLESHIFALRRIR
jgi:glycosidase